VLELVLILLIIILGALRVTRRYATVDKDRLAEDHYYIYGDNLVGQGCLKEDGLSESRLDANDKDDSKRGY
jgi:hypothetical protein